MNEYEEMLDDAEDQLDASTELTDAQIDQYESGTYPQTKEKSDLYAWFWRVTRLSKPTSIIRVGNLDKAEIGEHGISVRDAMNLATLGEIFHHEKFGKYWHDRAMVTSASSMAKKGWFMDLSISQRKVRERAKSSTSTPSEKWRLFGKKKEDTGSRGQ